MHLSIFKNKLAHHWWIEERSNMSATQWHLNRNRSLPNTWTQNVRFSHEYTWSEIFLSMPTMLSKSNLKFNWFALCLEIKNIKRPKNEAKLLVCPFEQCFKEFRETGNLKTHIRSHTGERPFKCKQCNLRFITKGHLKAHEIIHSGQKPFVCFY